MEPGAIQTEPGFIQLRSWRASHRLFAGTKP